MSKRDLIDPIHPRKVLACDFLQGMGIALSRLAVFIGEPSLRIGEIVHGNQGVTANHALGLVKCFKIFPALWMGLQSCYGFRLQRGVAGGELDGIQLLTIWEAS